MMARVGSTLEIRMRHKEAGQPCQPRPLLVDSEGRLSMDAEAVGEETLSLTLWLAEQEERLAQGQNIETPPPLG